MLTLSLHVCAQNNPNTKSAEQSVSLPKLNSSVSLYYEFNQGDSVVFNMDVTPEKKKIKKFQIVHIAFTPKEKKNIYQQTKIAAEGLSNTLDDIIQQLETTSSNRNFNELAQTLLSANSNGIIRGTPKIDSTGADSLTILNETADSLRTRDSLDRANYLENVKGINADLTQLLDSSITPTYEFWDKATRKWENYLFSGFNKGELKKALDNQLVKWQKENKESVLKIAQESNLTNQVVNTTVAGTDILDEVPLGSISTQAFSSKVFELNDQLQKLNLTGYISNSINLDEAGIRDLNLISRYVSAFSVFNDVIKSLITIEEYNGERIYTAQNASKLENQVLRISKSGIYAFTFKNGLWVKNELKVKRYCNLKLVNYKPPQDSVQVLLPITTYKIDSVFKVDTNSLAFTQSSPVLASTRNIFSSSKSAIAVNLQADSISQANISYIQWAYWVGIGDRALDSLNKFAAANAEKWAPYNITDPLVAYAMGLTNVLPSNTSGLEKAVNYYVTNDFNRARFLDGERFSQLQLTNKAPQYNKFDRPLSLNYALIDYQDPELITNAQIKQDGTVYICVENFQKASAIQVYVRAVGIISVKTEELIPVQHHIIKPKIFKIPKE